MDAGDSIREQSGANDAVAGLAVGAISEIRNTDHEGGSATATAFILNSLKHPDEVDALRSIYRNRFVLISVHSPEVIRVRALAVKIATSHGSPEDADAYEDAADAIVERDRGDSQELFGQQVAGAFVEADVFVSEQPAGDVLRGIERFFRLFFSNPFETPTRDEYGMFLAHSAAFRSADLSRQVGAAITNEHGEVVAVGCNEVPSPRGGQYWAGDNDDRRDFKLGYDSNAKYRKIALKQAFASLENVDLLDAGDQADFIDAMEGTRIGDLTEFGRPVHAEMAALLDAARRGSAVQGLQMFATTFPCHNCARHIIAAGLRKVVYREPYPKSLAAELHEDAFAVDPDPNAATGEKVVAERYVGIGPGRYLDLFAKVRRKNPVTGNKEAWSEGMGEARLITTGSAYLLNEGDYLTDLKRKFDDLDLDQTQGGGTEDGA